MKFKKKFIKSLPDLIDVMTKDISMKLKHAALTLITISSLSACNLDDNYEEEITSLEQQVVALQTQLIELSKYPQEAVTLQSTIVSMQAQLQAMETELSSMQTQINNSALTDTINALQAEIAALRVQLEALLAVAPRLGSQATKGVNLLTQNSEKVFQLIKRKVKWIKINYGQVLIFNQSLPHGNRVNRETETRWSLNCRFKNIFSPYGDKKIGEFFEPITLRAASEIGLKYKLPKMK